MHLIKGFLNSAEIHEIHDASSTLSESATAMRGQLYDDRVPEDSWIVKYMQTNDHLSKKIPFLVQKMFGAVAEANEQQGWRLEEDLSPENGINMRVCEYHIMDAGGAGLADPKHYDGGSIVTLDIMLSRPGVDFVGGAFSTLESTGSITCHGDDFEQGDAMLFVSYKCHHVTPVTHGRRNVFVTEFWRGPRCRCPHRCSEQKGACDLTERNLTSLPMGSVLFDEDCGFLDVRTIADAVAALRED